MGHVSRRVLLTRKLVLKLTFGITKLFQRPLELFLASCRIQFLAFKRFQTFLSLLGDGMLASTFKVVLVKVFQLLA